MTRKKWSEDTEHLLYELGFDYQDIASLRTINMTRFVAEIQTEILLEAQRYIDFIEDCSYDYELLLMRNKKVRDIR